MTRPKPSPTERIRLLDEAAQKLVQARILLRDAGAAWSLDGVADALQCIKMDERDAEQDAKELQV